VRADAQGRLLALALGGVLGLTALSAGLAWKLSARPPEALLIERALRDPEVQRQVVERLAENNRMPLDSHPDPDVSRLLLPSFERDDFHTDAIGMRERDFELAKPAGTVRIVLLGDSFVFGLNIPSAERLGAVLERELTARASAPGTRFECLHYGVNSWSLTSECAFLRRQLEQLTPDLVIQISISNDLDDVSGVRGFGTESTFTSQHRERADSILLDRYAQVFLGHNVRNFLSRGEDYESRERFRGALEAVQGLQGLLRELPGAPGYVLVGHWGPLNPILHANLGQELEPGALLYTPLDFSTDKDMWLTPIDPHWGVAGHARMAEVLYGLIRTRQLLPGVALGAWPEAEQRAEDWTRRGLEFAQTPVERIGETVEDRVAAIDCPGLSREEARQVHGGLDTEGGVSPYCSLVLERVPGATRLVLSGRALPERALRGLSTRVFLEELELGSIEHAPGAAFEREYALPPALQGRHMLNLRLVSPDYVYRGADLRHCVSFQLARAALE